MGSSSYGDHASCCCQIGLGDAGGGGYQSDFQCWVLEVKGRQEAGLVSGGREDDCFF